jgi:long-chain fatty acid transport protein
MKHSHRIMRACVAAALAGWSAAGTGAGFALIEQNASGLGNAYAGQAASAQDASTIYFNPAGMTNLSGKNIVFVGNVIKPSATFNNSATTPAVSTILGAGPYAL